MSIFVLLTAPFKKNYPKQNEDYNDVKRKENYRWLFYWTVIYAILGIFGYLFSDQTAIALRALKSQLIVCVIFFNILIILRNQPTIQAARVAVFTVVLLSVFNNFLDLIYSNKYIFSISEGRGAGFYINPNVSGAFIVIGMILSITLLPLRLRFFYCIFCGVGAFITFSRAAMLMWIFSFAGLSIRRVFKLSRYASLAIMVLLLAFLISMQFWGAFSETIATFKISEGAKQRLKFEPKKDKSIKDRLYVVERSFELILKEPLFGHGLGAAREGQTKVSSHNQFLFVGVEQGIIGIIIVMSLFLILMRCNSELGFVFAGILFIGFMSNHNLLEYPATFVAISIIQSMTKGKKS